MVPCYYRKNNKVEFPEQIGNLQTISPHETLKDSEDFFCKGMPLRLESPSQLQPWPSNVERRKTRIHIILLSRKLLDITMYHTAFYSASSAGAAGVSVAFPNMLVSNAQDSLKRIVSETQCQMFILSLRILRPSRCWKLNSSNRSDHAYHNAQKKENISDHIRQISSCLLLIFWMCTHERLKKWCALCRDEKCWCLGRWSLSLGLRSNNNDAETTRIVNAMILNSHWHDLLPKGSWVFWPQSFKNTTCLSSRCRGCCGFSCLHATKSG